MDYLIFLKWTTNWDVAQCCMIEEGQYKGYCSGVEVTINGQQVTTPACPEDRVPHSPPSIITTMINVPLAMGSTGTEPVLYAGQVGVQRILLLVAVASVPTMLFVKPYLEHKQHEAHAQGHRHLSDEEAKMVENDGPPPPGGGGDDEEHTLGDMLIHQGIEMIEFLAAPRTLPYLGQGALARPCRAEQNVLADDCRRHPQVHGGQAVRLPLPGFAHLRSP